MISELVLKYLKKAGLAMAKSYATVPPRSSKALLTRLFASVNDGSSKPAYITELYRSRVVQQYSP